MKYFFMQVMAGLIFLTTQLSAQPSVAPGYPIRLESPTSGTTLYGGPMLADLDQDGCQDIIVGSGKKVYCFRGDGSLLPGWPQGTIFDLTNPPAVGDLDRDGFPDIVAFDRSGGVENRKSDVYAWDYQGNLFPGFPLELGMGDCALTLYDLDQDGDLEIIGGFGHKVYVFHHDGTVASGWPIAIEGFTYNSKAAVGDVNADGRPDIVMAFENREAAYFADRYGRLYVWDASGQLLPGWPACTPHGYHYSYGCDPALADLNGDGYLEIAVGTRNFKDPPRYVGYAELYRYDGTLMPGWPIYAVAGDSLADFNAGPAVADIDADGAPELIFADTWDHVIAWEQDGSLVPGWPVYLSNVDTSLVFRSTWVNPAIGDIDGDGRLEILVNNNNSSLVNGRWLGRLFVIHQDGTSPDWSPLRTWGFCASATAAVGDLDNDNSLEIVTLSDHLEPPEKFIWLTVWKMPGVSFEKNRFPWPMYGRDRWHTSQYGFELPDEPVTRLAEPNEAAAVARNFILHQNYPNPFCLATQDNVTEICYDVDAPGEVTLAIFNIRGERVWQQTDQVQAPGRHHFNWSGKNAAGHRLPAGVYCYRLAYAPISGDRTEAAARKLLIVD